jgi:triacylglycerol lipase
MEYYTATSGLPPTVRLPPRDQAPPPEPESPAEKRLREAAERRTEILGKCPAELAAFACGASALAYHKQQEIRRQLKEEKATNVRFFDHGGSQAVGFEHLGRAWLVFRGTESYPETELFRDLSIDLFCLPMGWLPCHAGFRRAWAKLREPAREWLASVGKTAPLVITGHSLGGALALLAANEIALRGRATIEAVITFGAPRVGTWFWTYRYHRLKAIPSGDR